MISRCQNPDDKDYPEYGGRGIKVCVRWLDVRYFALDMGEKAIGQSIDREDPEGHYCPDNCRWTDALGQGENKRNNVMLEVGGVSMHRAKIWRAAGMSSTTLARRLAGGMSIDEALAAPVRARNTPLVINGVAKTIIEWSEHTGVKSGTIRYRLRHGVPPEQAIAP